MEHMGEGREVIGSPQGPSGGDLLAGRWRLVRQVGGGLVGNVFEAEDSAGDRVAICMLGDELSGDESLRKEFLAAAREGASVGHPDSTQMLAEGMTREGCPFVVAELLEGETFQKLLKRRRGRLYPAEALRLVRDALDVVAAAHEKDIVHGELTPSRLFITSDGTIKVLGFGVAGLRRRAAAQRGLTAVPGTARYAAPEQAAGGAATKASDLFALGAVLFTLFTGEATHGAAEPTGSIGPGALAAFAPGSPPALLDLLERALAPSPERRYPDARTMRSAVDQALLLPELLTLRSLRDAKPPPRAPARTRSREQPLSHRRTVPAPAEAHSAAPVLGGSPPPHTLARPAPVRIAERAALRGGWGGDTQPAMDVTAARDSAPESARRLVPACDRATVDGFRELFEQLERALAAQLAYGTENPQTQHEVSAFGKRAGALVSRTRTALHWNVTEHGFAASGRTVWQPQGDFAWVPARLYADGVRLLALLPGFDRSEARRLVEILARDPVAGASREDDLVTLLWQAALPHVMHHTVEPGQDERFDREIHETLALVRFDTSFQLEDCWRDARADDSAKQWREPLLRVLAKRRDEDGRSFVGGRTALTVDPAEREALAARLVGGRVSAARFEALLRAVESGSGPGKARS